MTRRLASLVRADLRSNFGLSIVRHRLFVEKRDRWLVPVIGMGVLGILPAIYALFHLVRTTYLILEPLGQQRALLLAGVMTGQLFVLLFGLYYVVSAFYFSRDLEFLVPLPLNPFEVVASKFTVILVNEYFTVVLIVLPVIAGYGIMAGSGPAYWTNAVLVYLFLPVIPLAIAALLVVALMRFVNISRKKDVVIVTGSVLLLLLVMGVQFLLGGARKGALDANAVSRFMTSPDSLLNLIGSRFPPSVWASKAIAGGLTAPGLMNLALFVGTSLAFFATLLVLAEQLFYRGLVGLAEVSGRRRTLTRAEMSQRVSSGRRPVRAVFAREWRIMNRTPIFLLNGTLVVLILPAMFALMARPGSREAVSFVQVMTSANPLYVVLSLAAFMVACGSLNGTSSSTFSREGAQFWISRVIPVAPREQVAAKFIHSYLVSLLGTATASIVVLWVLNVRAAQLVVAIGLSVVTGFLFTAAGMLIDLARPLLDWTNPQKAIKQNLNVLLAMCVQVGILAALYFAVRVMVRANLSNLTILVVLYVTLAALSALSYAALVRFAERRYREIET
jgi:ABC-2 type transport system permease protein